MPLQRRSEPPPLPPPAARNGGGLTAAVARGVNELDEDADDGLGIPDAEAIKCGCRLLVNSSLPP